MDDETVNAATIIITLLIVLVLVVFLLTIKFKPVQTANSALGDSGSPSASVNESLTVFDNDVNR